LQDLIGVLKTMQTRRGDQVHTTETLLTDSGVPTDVAPSTPRDPRVITRLAHELSVSAAKITSLQEELNEERRKYSAFQMKDKKVREMVMQLKNVCDLDEVGVQVMRELTDAASYKEETRPSMVEGVSNYISVSGGDRTIGYNERSRSRQVDDEGYLSEFDQSFGDYVDRIASDLNAHVHGRSFEDTTRRASVRSLPPLRRPRSDDESEGDENIPNVKRRRSNVPVQSISSDDRNRTIGLQNVPQTASPIHLDIALPPRLAASTTEPRQLSRMRMSR